MQSRIRFLKPNRYRKAVGDTDSEMGFGIHTELVRRGIAEWDNPPLAVASISAPVAATEEPPRRRSRRLDTDEKEQT